MNEPYIKDRFIVLNRLDFKDVDAHLVLLGQHSGKIVVLAKGVGKPTSKFSSLLYVGSMIEANLYCGTSGHTLISANQLREFKTRFETYAALLTSMVLCEISDSVTPRGTIDETVFFLLAHALENMDDKNVIEIRLRFELELLICSGYCSAESSDLLAQLKTFWHVVSFSAQQLILVDEIITFFEYTFTNDHVKIFQLSKTARKTLRVFLDELIWQHFSLKLKSAEILNDATLQFYS